ncbi:biopolymer transporter ExbD [Paraneptunicella aestuarii]|uniref:ExbD/TolR family protein n=1 Tax=Paraneptunicella aestuarii TaxID=2831148 RepID=UPI001E4B869A|nr:biopolymer transporter ExbD [Paraneptunicella aestuarii]UAA38555.1 biopolymer transporter ExbD [Paraneptunicella aestuarii]
MKKKHFRDEEDASIDMTPMLDIVFIMLIFFIVTTSFVKEEGLEVNRPDSSANSNSKAKTVSIWIDERGMIYMNNRLIDSERVTANIQSFLAENNTDSAVIKAHKKTKHGTVVKVLDQAAEAGLHKLSVVVDN